MNLSPGIAQWTSFNSVIGMDVCNSHLCDDAETIFDRQWRHKIPRYTGTSPYIDEHFVTRRIPKQMSRSRHRPERYVIWKLIELVIAQQQPSSRRPTWSLMRRDDTIIQHKPVRTLTLSIWMSYFGREISASSVDLKCLHVGQHVVLRTVQCVFQVCDVGRDAGLDFKKS